MKVLSLNCWGLPWTPDYKERMESIRLALLQSDYDFVVLQEIFLMNDIESFKESLAATFPYIHYFFSGFIGSGVMFLSKYRIRDPIVVPYNQSGMVYHTGGDWFSRKSVCYAKIDHPKKTIHAFGTHTHAKYIQNDYKAVRTTQLYFLARTIQLYTKPSDAIILAGDLNTESHEIGLKHLIHRCHLDDPFYHFYDDSSPIYTCNDRSNRYSCKRDLPYRIDYILNSKDFRAESYKVVFKQVPSKEIFFSDHYGIEVVLNYVGETATEDVVERSPMVETLNTMKRILNRGSEESCYSLTQNIMVGILLLLCYRLFVRVWRGLISKGTLFETINPIVYTGFLVIWVFSNLVSYISLRCQQRTYRETIEQINVELDDLV